MMKVGILGAGSIGCYLGGRLQASGVAVTYVGRGSVLDELERNGLRLTDFTGYDRLIPAAELRLSRQTADLARSDVVLVTVKGLATSQAAKELKPVVGPDTVVVSFQNGVQNPELLRAELGNRVLAAMVAFNVVRQDGRFHHGTSGVLVVQKDERIHNLLVAFRQAGLRIHTDPDMRRVLWGKLLLNLNNSINALAGIPLKQEIGQRAYRRILADAQAEALAGLGRAGITPDLGMGLPAWLSPHIMRLPDWLFQIVAARLVRIDPKARSSMWEDLTRNRPTEIDQINGEVVRLAESVGLDAPVNRAIVRLVRAAEGNGSPGLSADQLGRQIRDGGHS